MATIMPIEKLISKLREDKIPFSNKFLHHFSDLDSPSLNKLREVWFSFPVERRRALIIGMAELAEDDPLLFRSAGKLGLDDTDDDVVVATIDLLFEADDKRLVDAI